MPKVSVVLTSFNHENFIRIAIDSVLNQSFTDFELIIWDDASSDNSWSVIDSYTDPRIKKFRNAENKKPIFGVRKAITEIATGKYIAINHSDDYWEPDKLKKQVSYLDKNPRIGAVFTNAHPITEDGSSLADENHFYSKIFDQQNRTRHEWLRYFFTKGNALCHPSVLIRKSCYEDCGVYRFGFAQVGDLDMWIRLCMKYEIHILPDKLVKFRVLKNEINTSGNRKDSRIRSAYEFYKLLEHYKEISNIDDLVKIFPNARKYYNKNDSNVDYALAMVTLEQESYPMTPLFGMDILFSAISKKRRSAQIKRLYNFDYTNFTQITGKNDVFSLDKEKYLSEINAEMDCKIINLSQGLVEKDTHIDKLTQGLVEKDTHIDKLTQGLIDKDTHIDKLTQGLVEKDTHIDKLTQGLVEKDTHIDKLTQGLVEKDAHVDKLNQGLMGKDTIIANLDKALGDKDKNISEQQLIISTRDDVISKLTVQMQDMYIQIANYEKIKTLHNQQILNFVNSTSWKVTGPLRQITNLVKSLKLKIRSNNQDSKSLSISNKLLLEEEIIENVKEGDMEPSSIDEVDNALVSKLETVIAIKEQYISELQHNIEDKEKRIADIMHSTSWKITAPIRLLGNKIKGITTWLRGKNKQIYAPHLNNSHLIQSEKQNDETSGDKDYHTISSIVNFHLSPPLNLVVSDALKLQPRINVLLPSIRLKHMSGGPNTALLVAALLAEKGEMVRLIACDTPAEGEEASIYPHMDGLLQRPVARDRIEPVDAFDRNHPTQIGINDIFFATAWWTAQMAKYAVRNTVYKKFIYLIQDFEPILHENSTYYVRALETYGLPHIPIINTRLLRDHLVKESAGCYADGEFSRNALCFEPALDRDHYFPDNRNVNNSHKKTLLFYARPSIARRNLFEIGVVALRMAVASGMIDKENWEVWAMGEQISPVALGKDMWLNPLPWLDFESYAERVRTADLMLSLMLSPHPSYPPLEMAASGKLVVTNSYSVKTAARLKEYSPNIIVAEPNADNIAAAIENAAGRINLGMPAYDPEGTTTLPTSWDTSLEQIIPKLTKRIQELRLAPVDINIVHNTVIPEVSGSDYENYRKASLVRRRRSGSYRQIPGLLSFVTSAFDTDPSFLKELASSVFKQDGGVHFEWFILDNGSTNKNTQEALNEIAQHPNVRLERVEKNLGIIGGMRYCLENARGRYILPLDSDDLLEPDCIHVLTRAIVDAKYPALLYTDEDMINNGKFCMPYYKPDWDPVLFLHSCYIAHLCVIDRELGLQLGIYTDNSAEGCHDWDSFIRFMNAGYEPVHISEVLYSWRIHSGSTSGNIDSKSYITESHRNTLKGFLNQRDLPHIDLVYSPLFNQNVDWWFRRERVCMPSMCEFIIVGKNEIQYVDGNSEQNITIDLKKSDGLKTLKELIDDIKTDYIHFIGHDILPDDDEWECDAVALMELFPDTVMVGGIIHDNNCIVEGSRVFGFGNGFDCPDIGVPLAEPGYRAKLWKPHTISATSIKHCVISARFFKDSINELVEENVPIEMLSLWLGALAFESQQRVVYSPFMRAQVSEYKEEIFSDHSSAKFLSRFWHIIPDNRVYSDKLGLSQERAYSAVMYNENQKHLVHLQDNLLNYPDWLDFHIRQRAKLYNVPDRINFISLITTIYEGTNISLLDELAESVMEQTVKPKQWVIVAHGPISSKDIDKLINKKAKAWGVTVIVEKQSLGIMGAMHRALQETQGDYYVPVDADDVLTKDAIQILTWEILNSDYPDFVFSDEDTFVDGYPNAPYLRSTFDPIMNLDSSYIWHLCAIKRVKAVELGVYTDHGATWCHDWDSITRFAKAGGRIKHIPEILYHWRMHGASTTNNSQGSQRSLESVRHLLEKHIGEVSNPQDFYVADWPVNRGSPELYIARRIENMPKFHYVGDVDGERQLDYDDNSILVIAEKGVSINSSEVFIEVARLMELHSDVGVVGGVVENSQKIIVDGCYIYNARGFAECPWIGRDLDYGGPYALAQKTQRVAIAGNLLAFVRISALLKAGLWPQNTPDNVSILIRGICEKLDIEGWHIAFSPLVRAHILNSNVNYDLSTKRPQQEDLNSRNALQRYGLERSFKM